MSPNRTKLEPGNVRPTEIVILNYTSSMLSWTTVCDSMILPGYTVAGSFSNFVSSKRFKRAYIFCDSKLSELILFAKRSSFRMKVVFQKQPFIVHDIGQLLFVIF